MNSESEKEITAESQRTQSFFLCELRAPAFQSEAQAGFMVILL